jgi:RNA polymerase sigma-70 factor (ECF subfamily)
MPAIEPDSAETSSLLERIGQGDSQALESLLERQRDRMQRFVELRMDRRLRARLDPSDVVQEAQMEITRRMEDFLRRRPMPFHVWARKTVYERLLNLQRDHLRRHKRSVQREAALPEVSSQMLVQSLLSKKSSPSQHLQARELAERLDWVLGQMDDADREIILLRQVEKLPYEEIACMLDIELAAARKRFGRALIRLQKFIAEEGLLE